MRLDPILKQQWIDALQSGEYKQDRRKLETPDSGFCCLGVLANIQGWDYIKGVSGNLDHIGRGDVIDTQTQNQLITLSDFERKGFNQIANWIQEHL